MSKVIQFDKDKIRNNIAMEIHRLYKEKKDDITKETKEKIIKVGMFAASAVSLRDMIKSGHILDKFDQDDCRVKVKSPYTVDNINEYGFVESNLDETAGYENHAEWAEYYEEVHETCRDNAEYDLCDLRVEIEHLPSGETLDLEIRVNTPMLPEHTDEDLVACPNGFEWFYNTQYENWVRVSNKDTILALNYFMYDTGPSRETVNRVLRSGWITERTNIDCLYLDVGEPIGLDLAYLLEGKTLFGEKVSLIRDIPKEIAE